MKKSTEPCPKGCKGRIIYAESGKYCQCIESKLAGTQHGRSKYVKYTDKIEALSSPPSEPPKVERSKKEVIKHLKIYGLEDFEIEMIWLRFYEGLTFKELVEHGGWTSIGSAAHYYKLVLAKLRKKGFSFDPK